MLGILVWFDDRLRSGVVWCEDQGALAYLGAEVVAQAGMCVGEGDLLEVRVSSDARPRCVEAVLAVRQPGGGSFLKDILLAGAEQSRAPRLRVVA
ncbi:MAG TPA: hypothetical protein ENK83_08225 [Aliiroseovarius sp.]|nr:hypothetical protein [Aliiroseovarius sp.]